MRSPIRGAKYSAFRGCQTLCHSFVSPRSSFLNLEAALSCGESHAIVAGFLSSAQRGNCGILRRVLSCGASRDVLLSACVAMVTPSSLWPPFVAQHLKAPREGRDADLASTSWRAFAFTLVRCIHAAHEDHNHHDVSNFGLLCATSLAPSLQLGERLAGLLLTSVDHPPTVTTTTTTTNHYSDVAMAFATCCSMTNVDVEKRDAAWMRLWAEIRSKSDGVLGSSWARCHEMHLSCLLRAKRLGDIETVLREIIDAELLPYMSDSILAELFLLESLTSVIRDRILAAILEVSRIKSEAGAALAHVLSPFERNRGLPSLTKSSTLFAKALHCLVLQAREDPSVENSTRVLRDIQGICSLSNSYGIAASLVPHGSTLASLMTASINKQRADFMATFVEGVAEVVDLACGFSRRPDGSGRHDDCVEATLQGCTDVLTGVLELCSNRRDKLPQRRAEPEWRKRLHRDAPVRSHKYELICGELPHTLLSRCLTVLLRNGFLNYGGKLGCCLVVADFVDLNFYTLSLLGSLYHAVRMMHPKPPPPPRPDVLVAVSTLYQRRREVFGEDLPLTAQYMPTASLSSTDGLVLCDTAVVQYRGAGTDARTKRTFGFLQSCSTVAAGGSIVIDGSFGVWLRKASASVVWY